MGHSLTQWLDDRAPVEIQLSGFAGCNYAIKKKKKERKKKQTNKKTPSSQSFYFLRLAYKDKEKGLFFFFLYGSFFAPTIGITRDRNISNYTLNQIIPTHKR